MGTTLTVIFLLGTFLSLGQTRNTLKGKPTTLEETFFYLDNIFDDTAKYNFMTLPEDIATARLHLGFGMWIRNHWGLWRNSKLKHYFIEQGVTHPDNMSGIILTSYYRYLNNQPIDLDEQIKKPQRTCKEEDISRTTDSMLLTYFPIGDTILTSIYITKKVFLGGTNGSSVEATAVVREHKKDKLLIQILTIEDFRKWEPTKNVGDIYEVSPIYCSLIPPQNWVSR